jgi:putative DNA-invertase from lambdoid prophage Rac
MTRTKESLDSMDDGRPQPKTYGYIRASSSKQISSPEVQKGIICKYAEQLELGTPIIYADPATSGKTNLFDRQAGKELMKVLRKGDHLVVARLDRISRSFINFAKILDAIEKRGVVLHLCDAPGGGCLDPSNPIAMLTAHILVSFAQFERQMIRTRSIEGCANKRALGQRYCPKAPYGYKWEKKYVASEKRHIYLQVPHPGEQACLRKTIELRAAGHTFDETAKILTKQYGYRTRNGSAISLTRCQALFKSGLQLVAHEARLNNAKLEEITRQYPGGE